MKCPYCSNAETKVLDSRYSDSIESIRRRRECLECSKRFTTYERIEMLDLVVIKKDGRREDFSREKLMKGFLRACEKRPVSREEIERVVGEIESEVRNLEDVEVPSRMIGELVMDKLKNLDEVAYVRFASVYRSFKAVNQFMREIERLKTRKTKTRKIIA